MNLSTHGGQHLCLPFETADESESVAAAFLAEGLLRRNRCVFAGKPREFAALERNLARHGISAEREVSHGALELSTMEDLYLDEHGRFNPELMLERIQNRIDDALGAGFTGLRGTGELMHVPLDRDWEKIVWYEAQINEHFARQPVAVLCRYHRSVVPAARVRDVLRTHPIAVVRHQTCDNPFYERPELVLSDDATARLDWQLHQLRAGDRAHRRLSAEAASAAAAAAELAAALAEARTALGKRDRSSD
jgi:DcmR-like sensory protein